MNEQLKNELENAFNIMADIEEVQKLILIRQNKINGLDEEYRRIKGYPARKGLQSGIVFLVTLCCVGLIVNYLPEQAVKSFGSFFLLIIPIAIILNLVRIIVTEKNRKLRADSWWDKTAQPQVAELNSEIKRYSETISAVVAENPVLSRMPAGMRTCDILYDLMMIVERGKAHTLSAAMDVWFSKQENRRYREEVLENMERIQSNQHELHGELGKVNRQLGEISFMEEVNYYKNIK